MSAKLIDKLCLGTAQFGAHYGIANDKGRIPEAEVFDILVLARDSGIRYLDTADSYGDSEYVIGSVLSCSDIEFNIVSKFLSGDNDDSQIVTKNCKDTLLRLRQQNIYGYLVHNLREDNRLWNDIQKVKQNKLVHKIGLSIYTIREMEWMLENNIKADIVQVPYSIFDQRFEKYFPVLKQMNVEIFARSVFLQGLFFLGDDKIKKRFYAAKDSIEKLRAVSSEHDVPIHALCLCFALMNPCLDRVIMGVDTLEHLKQNLDSIRYYDAAVDAYSLLRSLELHDEDIILPYKWK